MSEADHDTPDTSRDESVDARAAIIPVVGVGVSAASLNALETLLASIGPDVGAAWLIAMHQKNAVDVATLVDRLGHRSKLAVAIARHGDAVEPNHAYIVGPEDLVRLRNGRLEVRPTADPLAKRGVIDTLLISLAETAHDRSVAVLLGGLESDGSAGVTATKKFGGLSIAEASNEGSSGPWPGAAGPLGVVDLRLPANRIATQIALYFGNLAIEATPERDVIPTDLEAQVAQITTSLRNITGHDFHGYKRGTFLRRVHRRLHVLQLESIEDYVVRLREDREEVQNLFQDLLIGVTQFFRDPQEFDLLERELPRLFSGKGPDDAFRVWVLGCATGEEAYSIAILLREHMATLDRPPRVQIFATDLDARALGLARAGRYATSIADHVQPDRLERWFVREGDTYCVSKELREMCIFSPHNLIKDAPFSRVDVLSCRNLLIYLNTDLQNRVIPIFHFSLQSGGVLFLGSSENVTRHQKLFAPIDRRARLFRRLETATRVIPEFPLSARSRATEVHNPGIEPLPAVRPLGAISRQAEAIAERHTPAYVVVDAQGEVLHFSGRTGRYLEPITGVASLNISALIHRDLRIDLRSALQRALAEGRRVEVPQLVLNNDDHASAVNLVVEPVGTGDLTAFVVLFQDAGSRTGDPEGRSGTGNEHVERLETELRVTRDRLQTTIEELESTNEELKSSNEEYQSINEELQSANEEMETSKEELQSVNEELQTVNGELGHRVSELARSNSDLKNLLEATQIATLFLDNELRVRSFTPTATDIFHLLETDVGRPLDHVVSRVAYPGLSDDVRRVLKTLVAVERTVVDPATERHFAAKVLPYRSIDNYISGAVVTFNDLTAVHRAETALRRSEGKLQALLDASSQLVFRMNADWSEMIDMSGKGFLSDTRESRGWLMQHIPEDEQPLVRAEIARALGAKDTFSLEHRVWLVDGTVGWALSRAVPIIGAGGEIVEWFGAASDVSARRIAEEALRDSEQRLLSLLEGLTQLVWRADRRGWWTWASRQWSDYSGQSESESLAAGWLDAIHPDDRNAVLEAWRDAEAQGGFELEVRIRRASDGAYRWFQTRATPVRDVDGAPVEWIGTSTDVDDLRDLQARQEVLVAELQHRTRNLIAIVRQMAQKTASTSSDLDDFRTRFRERLDSLARVQGLLSRLNEHDRIAFDELLRSELAAHGVEPGQDDRVTLDGPSDVRLRSTTVQTLAMALHELATNAVKYGALGQRDAKLSVTWRQVGRGPSGEPWLEVEWRETGVAMPPPGTGPQGGGQGRELIERALPYQLAATTTYVHESDGVRCTIAMPISETNRSVEDDHA